ncbi:hypothetical protein HIK39_003574 [Shigella dysenteriae]|nr:hypothetical protein [Escherichia coli]EFP6925870.1 hypothetical protein [Shigella dysenteriae]EJF5753391.1 hypothetical protein [Shigella sonnei]EFP8428385.1 hypothetical protein [Shigella dysenteriae]EFP9422957.1 hypothetical protein [Shigella dysenteriae]
MRKKIRPKKFIPTLSAIQETDIPEPVVRRVGELWGSHNTNNESSDYGVLTKKWDTKEHRKRLLQPHKYPFKHSRSDPNVRYSYQNTSEGLRDYINQQRKKRESFQGEHKRSLKKELDCIHKCNKQRLVQITKSPKEMDCKPYSFITGYELWCSPKHTLTQEEIDNIYGERQKKWDALSHKNKLISQGMKPTRYGHKHATGDKTRRLSYDKSSDGLRDFIKKQRSVLKQE